MVAASLALIALMLGLIVLELHRIGDKMATGAQALQDLQNLINQLVTDVGAVAAELKDLLAAIQSATGGGPGAAQVEALVTQGKTALTSLESALAAAKTSAPPISVAISPTSASVAPGATEQFTATVSNAGDPTVTWKALNGSVDANGLYTAPATAGTDTVTATSEEDPTKSAAASVTVA
jgi:hypothetical protein